MKRLLLILAVLTAHSSIAQFNLQLRSNMPYPGEELSNIYGYVDTAGNEYALVGGTFGTDIVDVTVPTNPVSRFIVPGPTSGWREIKTYKKFAYITTEAGGGLTVVDLSQLPDTILYKQYTGDSTIAGLLESIHALHCDTTKGFLYLYGSNINDGNTLFLDLTDPWNPTYVGEFVLPGSGFEAYVHDGYADNDTLYEGHINAGFFTVVDVTDKANPVLLATQNTPTNFTHNTWLSVDHRTLFTTDEQPNSYLTAYDISDLGNITELSRFQTNPGSNAIVHNTHILNDYAITSWYVEGVVIVDEARPRNPIEVAKYDTYNGGQSGFHGDWGVYPFLPSGTIVVSDIEGGLFVFSPTYMRGCYLEGTVRDSITLTPLNGARVEILSTSISKLTDVLGEYRTGTVDSGLYVIRISKPGYVTKTIINVQLDNGILTPLDVLLSPLQTFAVSGTVTNNSTSAPVPNAVVTLDGDLNYSTTANAGGVFSFNAVQGSYVMYTGAWGFHSSCDSVTLSPGMTLQASVDPGYYDDFNLDLGWTVNGTSLNAWERGDPIGTFTNNNTEVNPEDDASTDCGPNCFVTDNGGAPYNDHDVDDGNTILTSPVFDATLYLNPMIEYYRRYQTFSGMTNDTMYVRLSNGINTEVLEAITPDDFDNGTWVQRSFPVQSIMTPTANMRLIIEVMDNPQGNIVEGAFDQFEITGVLLSKIESPDVNTSLNVYPNPTENEFLISYELKQRNDNARLIIHDIAGRVVYQKSLSGGSGIVEAGRDLTAGSYLVVVENGTSQTYLKVIKQ